MTISDLRGPKRQIGLIINRRLKILLKMKGRSSSLPRILRSGVERTARRRIRAMMRSRKRNRRRKRMTGD